MDVRARPLGRGLVSRLGWLVLLVAGGLAVVLGGQAGAISGPLSAPAAPSPLSPPADYSLAMDVSDDGWIVGTAVVVDAAHPHQTHRHAVIWLPRGQGMVDLGAFAPAAEDSLGMAIGTNGRAVGDAVYGGFGSARGDYAALWRTQSKRRIDLSSGDDSVASDINAHGQIVGSVGYGLTHACMWRSGTQQRVMLGTLRGDASGATANNDLGQVVGWSDTKKGRIKAFIWDPRTRDMVPLGGFDRRVERVVANDINNKGQVVGTYDDPKGRTRAFLWHPRNRSVTDLGTLGGDTAEAWSINEHSVVVGTAQRPNGSMHAFRWTPDTRSMKALPNVPAASTAYAINERGQVVGVFEQVDPQIGSTGPNGFLWRPRSQTVRILPPLVIPLSG